MRFPELNNDADHSTGAVVNDDFERNKLNKQKQKNDYSDLDEKKFSAVLKFVCK